MDGIGIRGEVKEKMRVEKFPFFPLLLLLLLLLFLLHLLFVCFCGLRFYSLELVILRRMKWPREKMRWFTLYNGRTKRLREETEKPISCEESDRFLSSLCFGFVCFCSVLFGSVLLKQRITTKKCLADDAVRWWYCSSLVDCVLLELLVVFVTNG